MCTRPEEADLPLHRLNQLYDDFWRQGAQALSRPPAQPCTETSLEAAHSGAEPRAGAVPHILDAAERSKGAAGVRCRQLDGRAAILMVVTRPGGCELAGSVRGSSARWPFTCLGGIPPVTRHWASGTRLEGVARISSRPTLAFASILPAMRIAASLATPFIPQLPDGLSEPAAFRRRDAVEDCVRSAHRVAARRPRTLQNRRPRARASPGRLDALPTGYTQGSRRCRSSWAGCRVRQAMITRFSSLSLRRSVPR